MKELLRLPDTNTLKIVTNNKTCNKSGIIRYDILRNIKKHIISVNNRRKNWKKPKKRRNSIEFLQEKERQTVEYSGIVCTDVPMEERKFLVIVSGCHIFHGYFIIATS